MAGEYRLLRKLGEGGFGAVYEAEHPLLKRRAAVKVLHRVADKDSDAVLRFISEAQAVNQIRNRHIIDVFSFGKLNDGRHFYVMDLLDGAPLDRWLKQQGRVEVSAALALLTPIAEALDLAHAAGIVHRDLKPQNIFLAWDQSGETIPKLLDFGMAKLLGESPVHTVSGTPIGTPLYMSPEQARGEKVDHRSDVYALGVLCHEMLTGHLPFVGDTTVAVLMAHIIQTAPRASEVCADLSPLLDAPLLRMLEKKPDERPASAGAAIAALRQAAHEAGIELSTGPLRLPRPPAISGEHIRSDGPPDTLLDEMLTTERDAASAPSSGGSTSRPLWPFGVGLLALGALLGFVVLRSAPTAPQAEPSAAPSGPVAAAPIATPSVVAPAPPESAAALPSAVPSTAGLPSATPEKKPKTRAVAPARIPTDLENPF
jgi:serine/threonine-protein kinase